MERQEQLRDFVKMYGHLALDVIKKYNAGQESSIVLSDIEDGSRILPDMNISYYSKDEFAHFNTDLITVSMMLNQFNTSNKSHQCVVGLRFLDGSVITDVVQIATKKMKTSK
tara:strand:+ start:551 stop:886 length:336 start_codon:yes stop_codon:yes gene_type:complete